MTNNKANNQNRKDRFEEDLYNNFFKLLTEPREIPWEKSWLSVSEPVNYFTGRRYNGVNRFMLMAVAILMGYNDPRWLSIGKVLKAENLHIKKGSKGAHVKYTFPIDSTQKDSRGRSKTLTWSEYEEIARKARTDKKEREHLGRIFLRARTFVVFNASCIDGVEPYVPKGSVQKYNGEKLLGELADNMGVKLVYDPVAQGSFYNVKLDEVHLPESKMFHTENDFIYTGLHELCHASGSANRLNRKKGNEFGSPEYAFEELIAEMGSVDAASRLGIHDLNSSCLHSSQSYITSWLKACKEPEKDLAEAIKQADKAATFVTSEYIKQNKEEPKQTAEDADRKGVA